MIDKTKKRHQFLFLLVGFFGSLFPLEIVNAQVKQPKASTGFYSMDDYPTIAKIDAHVHIRTEDTTFSHRARLDQFNLLSIVVEEPPGMDQQQKNAINQMHQFPDLVAFATTFSIKNWNNGKWEENTIAHLKHSLDKGAIAVKIYKIIGMELRDLNGDFVMIDDARFDPIFDFLSQHQIPVIGHNGEPKNCWLPMEEMTMETDRRYYQRHPEFYMYLHPDYPSYEDQIAARDRMLEKHPNLKFVGAHLGSMEWNVDEIAKRLDQFPNMAVDLAARMSHLQYQAMKNRAKVRDFFIKYQDRILYGTDRIASDTDAPVEWSAFVHQAWKSDWKFLCTEEKMKSGSFEGDFTGLKLPKTVVDKIYQKNAKNWFPGLTSE